MRLLKYLKDRLSEHLSEIIGVTGLKHCSNLQESTFNLLFHLSETEGVEKRLSFSYLKCYDIFLTHLLQVASILVIMGRISRN